MKKLLKKIEGTNSYFTHFLPSLTFYGEIHNYYTFHGYNIIKSTSILILIQNTSTFAGVIFSKLLLSVVIILFFIKFISYNSDEIDYHLYKHSWSNAAKNLRRCYETGRDIGICSRIDMTI